MLAKRGSKGEQVKLVQLALGLKDDGDFGPLTEKAVIKFQSENNLKPDGEVGDKTWAVLKPKDKSKIIVSLIREKYVKGKSTIGDVTVMVDGQLLFSARSLELEWFNNAPFFSCIPEGTYECVFSMSPAFKRATYEVLNVPKRSGIRIHSANYAEDTRKGEVSHLEGCIALGDKVTVKDDDSQTVFLHNSVNTVKEFESLLASRPFTLKISRKE